MTDTQPTSPVMRTLRFFASLKFTVVGLLVLTVLTVWGTLYQVEHGLYEAQARFYHSWWFLGGGWIPFPGGQTVMALLIVNLVASLVVLAVTRRLTLGYLLTHGGLLLMLVAGAVTFYYGDESQLVLLEGQSSNVSIAGRERELAVFPDPGTNAAWQVSAIDARALKPGAAIALPGLGLDLKVNANQPNAMGGAGAEGGREQAAPGLDLVVRRGHEERRIVLTGADRQLVPVTLAGREYEFVLRSRRVPLPVTIKLLDFERVMHPGSDMARSYSSRVLVSAQGVDRQVLISMNKPLRLHGLTFFQSSYAQLPDGRESSTFQVVRNYGRLMPYIATGVTVVGMAINFMGMLLAQIERRRKAGAA